MQIVNDVQAMMMHQEEKIKIYQNWIIMIDAVRNADRGKCRPILSLIRLIESKELWSRRA
jgi:hypothetical protein